MRLLKALGYKAVGKWCDLKVWWIMRREKKSADWLESFIGDEVERDREIEENIRSEIRKIGKTAGRR